MGWYQCAWKWMWNYCNLNLCSCSLSNVTLIYPFDFLNIFYQFTWIIEFKMQMQLLYINITFETSLEVFKSINSLANIFSSVSHFRYCLSQTESISCVDGMIPHRKNCNIATHDLEYQSMKMWVETSQGSFSVACNLLSGLGYQIRWQDMPIWRKAKAHLEKPWIKF